MRRLHASARRAVARLAPSALMVVPVATSQQLARSFRTTFVGAMLVLIGKSISGMPGIRYAACRGPSLNASP